MVESSAQQVADFLLVHLIPVGPTNPQKQVHSCLKLQLGVSEQTRVQEVKAALEQELNEKQNVRLCDFPGREQSVQSGLHPQN